MEPHLETGFWRIVLAPSAGAGPWAPRAWAGPSRLARWYGADGVVLDGLRGGGRAEWLAFPTGGVHQKQGSVHALYESVHALKQSIPEPEHAF